MSLGASQVDPAPAVAERHPAFEGANIAAWIGFKHIMYLAEEAVLQALRDRGMRPGQLFKDHGLCLEVVDSHFRLLHSLDVDDVVRLETRDVSEPGEGELALAVNLFVPRQGSDLKAATGRLKVLFRKTSARFAAWRPPDRLADYVRHEIRRSPSGRDASPETVRCRVDVGSDAEVDAEIVTQLVPDGANAFVSSRRIPYYYCHFTDRLQHSGYLRLTEEVVDLFLAARGLSIGRLLRERDWIPVVSEARLEILRDAFIEETLFTIFTVERIFKRLTYTARVDCYVLRDGWLVRTATGRITHGYVHIEGRGTGGGLAEFDDDVLTALAGIGGRR
jgi:acyl-CoA thioesterase FadM